MVRHGTLKKRRSGRKVSRKGSSNKYNIYKSIKNIEIKKNWNILKSPKENFSSLGIEINPNKQQRNKINKSINLINKNSSFLGFMSLPTNQINDSNPKRKILSEYDQEYIITLINKHNCNYKNMFKDIKINHLQLTEQKLKKMFEKYCNLPINQRISLEITSPIALSFLSNYKSNSNNLIDDSNSTSISTSNSSFDSNSTN